MWHSPLNGMEIPETKSLVPRGFELGTTLSFTNFVHFVQASLNYTPNSQATNQA